MFMCKFSDLWTWNKLSNICWKWQTTKRKLPGGTVVEDLKRGQGQTAKKGQTVSLTSLNLCNSLTRQSPISVCVVHTPHL